MGRRVFVSGFFDMLHSGHVEFLKAASRLGDLYVGVGSDLNYEEVKGRKAVYSESERLYMVKALRYVTDASINRGTGLMDFTETVEALQPDVFVATHNGANDSKREFCREHGIEFVEVDASGMVVSESKTTEPECRIPYRIDLAGTWIDQPYVSRYAPGWALTVSIEPTHQFMERGGMSTSTRNAAKKLWPYELPNYDEALMAHLLFCLENDPENKEHISGAQDAIGICMSGAVRHYYDNCYWPKEIESCKDERVLSWLEQHLCLAPMFPRRPGTSVVAGMDITEPKVKRLAEAADRCWQALKATDFDGFVRAYNDSFEAQIAMFPAMMQPGVEEHIEKWRRKGAKAIKMCGAGGGGHLALVFDTIPDDKDLYRIKVRR